MPIQDSHRHNSLLSQGLKRRLKFVACCLSFFLLAGCGGQITFEPVDYKGHVRVEKDGVGYCLTVPKDWEIREKLEDSDVVCLAPVANNFRESIVTRTLTAYDLSNPEETIAKQLESLGESLTVLTPWTGPDEAVVLTLDKNGITEIPLAQLVFIHQRPEGGGVLITCTTRKERLQERTEFFKEIVAKTKYDLEDCTGPGGLPKVFPTPNVTLSPAP